MGATDMMTTTTLYRATSTMDSVIMATGGTATMMATATAMVVDGTATMAMATAMVMDQTATMDMATAMVTKTGDANIVMPIFYLFLYYFYV